MKLVSFIIPHYNSSELLEYTLESLVNQTYSNKEILVVDDGSDAAHLERLKQLERNFAQVTFLSRPSDLPKGANSCRNYGVKVAKGDFLNFVDADDLLIAEKISKQVAVFETDSSLDIVVCQTEYFLENDINNRDGVLQKVDFSPTSDFLQLFLSRQAVWCTNSALIKKSALGEVSFKEGQLDAHEWLFYILLLLQGAKVGYLNEVLVLKRKHVNTIGQSNFGNRIASLIEARLTVYGMIEESKPANYSNYLGSLRYELNSLLKSAAKLGKMSLFFKTLYSQGKSPIAYPRLFSYFLIIYLFKKGDSIRLI